MCRLLGEGVAPTAAAGIAHSHATPARSDRHRTGQRIAQLEAAEHMLPASSMRRYGWTPSS
jgi:hypothetical protein